MSDPSRWHRVVPLAAVPAGRARAVSVAGYDLLVCHTAGEVHVIANFCTHDRKPIGDGRVRNGCVECPRHGARFAVRDGSVQAGPALLATASYPARVVDATVEVVLPDAPTART
jgi:3-phenylpropionate/trans-cinnamate dioxygenase ferredoxin subunit